MRGTRVRSPRALPVAVATTGAVVVADLVTKAVRPASGEGGGWLRWFDTALENNVPTYWSAFLLLIVSVSCALRRWWLPAAGVLAAAADEVFGWHEHLRSAGHQLERAGVRPETHAWVVPGAAVGVVVCLVALRWARRLPPATRRGLQLALVVYAGGVLGVEAVGGYLHGHGASWRQSAYLTSLEETLEMAGVLIALRAVLRAAPLRENPVALVRGARERPVSREIEGLAATGAPRTRR